MPSCQFRSLDIDQVLPNSIKIISTPDQCDLCYNMTKRGDLGRELKCGHLFHRECIDSWFQQDDEDMLCPTCYQSQFIL